MDYRHIDPFKSAYLLVLQHAFNVKLDIRLDKKTVPSADHPLYVVATLPVRFYYAPQEQSI